MRSLGIFAACAVACAGHPTRGPTPPAIAAAFPAARWIPDHPTYVLAAPTLRDAQRAIRGTADALGLVAGASAADASRALAHLIAVDPLDPDAVAAIGVDPAGGVALFSEDLDPTVVVHLAAPDAFAAFIEHQRELGLVTQSVVVDGDEVFTVRLGPGLHVSWAVDHEWLWVHVAIAGAASTAWFAHAHHPAGGAWTASWAWAQARAERAPGVRGFVELRALVARLASRVPDALACARLVQPIQRVGVSFGSDGHHVEARLAFDLGAPAPALRGAILPPPPGWAAAAAQAPLSAAWNLDLAAVARWLAPCTGLAGEQLDAGGVRAARALVQRFDPDDKRATRGALAIDLSSTGLVTALLDRIPMRSHLETARAFGPYRGHRVAVPFVATFDYVLTDHLALAAVGDGVLDAIVAGTPHAPAGGVPIFALDVAPPGLPAAAWRWMLEQLGAPDPAALTGALQRWRRGHLAARLDGQALVIELSGDRR